MRLIKRTYYSIYFIFFYLWKLVTANLQIAWDIITPVMKVNPGFVEVGLTLKTDPGILLFSNLVSMTPGTLSIDIDEARTHLKIHLLYMDRSDSTLKELAGMQQLIKKISE